MAFSLVTYKYFCQKSLIKPVSSFWMSLIFSNPIPMRDSTQKDQGSRPRDFLEISTGPVDSNNSTINIFIYATSVQSEKDQLSSSSVPRTIEY